MSNHFVASLETALASLVGRADRGDDGQSKPTVVLVHGAFADASGWEPVAARLHRRGFPVIAVPNPLRGLAYDTAYLQGLLAGVEGPKILVGHSYAGAVISNAALAVADVTALVFVAAFVPDEGEALGGLLEAHADASVPSLPQQVFQFTRPDGSTGTEVWLDHARFGTAFAADVDAATAAYLAISQRPVAAEAFGEAATAAGWKTVPSWALVATKDNAIAPSLERFMAERAGATVTEVDSSHAVMLSHPDAVADLVEQAHRGTR
ncbi:short chain dehydrogenase [Nocardia otitidiscaviarum]|uniref:Short chain dehydrogenase n=1 Tax=Nocardia otitidiscaviarum TaxID=1823 RepID=A0A379JHN1_9NOCA|nr:alpha/beta hydrolase [Nocardia otitidiscaviarum]SUD47771.1 short chain dehydrogenase [Nocardia otitidiscaviarum]